MIVGTTDFQISTNRSGRNRTFNVRVYDDLKAMRRDAANWTKRVRGESEDFGGALGVTHRNERLTVSEGKDDVSHDLVGMIRIHRSALRTGIITHEVAHAALWVFELDCGGRPTTENHEQEEVFCHIVGSLTAKFVHKLYEKQLLPSRRNHNGN